MTTSAGEMLEKQRRKIGLTRPAVAELVHVKDPNYVYALERGFRRIPAAKGEVFANAVQMPAELRQKFLAAIQSEKHSSPLPPTNMRTPLSKLVGRDQNIKDLTQLLADNQTRLVTLTGPGGVGKTRLAIEVGYRVLSSFSDGVWFIDLENSRNSDESKSAISRALVDQFDENVNFDLLVKRKLKDKQELLILDNIEQISEVSLLLNEILGLCKNIKILTTSRARIRISGAKVHNVVPLPEVQARELFVRIIGNQDSGLDYAKDNAEIVSGICGRLDGLPLTIEIAAARVPDTSLDELYRQLSEDPLTTLSGGPDDLPDRQQAIRKTIAWSYDLLEPFCKALFRRLAVFPASFTYFDVQDIGLMAIKSLSGEQQLDRATVLSDIIQGIELLNRSSLLSVNRADGKPPAYSLLTILRAFAREQLEANKEDKATSQTFANSFLKVANQAKAELVASRQADALRRLDTEWDNLSTAIQWAIAEGDIELSLGLTGALWEYWETRALLSVGRDLLERALMMGRAVHADDEIRSEALRGAGMLAYRQSEYERARQWFDENLKTDERWGNRRAIARSLNNCGLIAEMGNDYHESRLLYERALEICREERDIAGEARELNNLGTIERAQCNYAGAKTLFEQSLELEIKRNDRRMIALVRTNLGAVAVDQVQDLIRDRDHLQEARYQLEASLHISKEEVPEEFGTAWTHATLGELERRSGNLAEASRYFTMSLKSRKESGRKIGVAQDLEGLACVASDEQHHPEFAVLLFAAADKLRKEIKRPKNLNLRRRYAPIDDRLRIQLEDAYDMHWQAGAALTWEMAAEIALERWPQIAP